MREQVLFLLLVLTALAPAQTAGGEGYRGIWFTLGQPSEFGDKYSGGLGTYTANHVPMAIYAPAVKKTFFVYGGSRNGERYLLDMIGCFDHLRGEALRPVVVHDKQGVDDPHDNPSLAIDKAGYLWVFVSGRGKVRPGLIYRSKRAYDIDGFELISQSEFTYPQPRWMPNASLFHTYTRYTKGRELYWNNSADGKAWGEERKLAGMGGHYQTSHIDGQRVITAFNMHPNGNVDLRTNLYFLQTDDAGRTWRDAANQPVATPLTDPQGPGLVRDYRSEKQLVYIHDLGLAAAGHPVILYTTSAKHVPGPPSEPRSWTIAHYDGRQWHFHLITSANHNYSTGALWVEGRNWMVLGPTEKGPQALGSGGEIAFWTSRDAGRTWKKQRDVTRQSARNHNYVRRVVNAHPDFAAFWADGNPDTQSPSFLYFSDREGKSVWRLPYDMKAARARPERVR
jgi:hypothetical protein